MPFYQAAKKAMEEMTNIEHTPWVAEYIDRHNNSGVKDAEGDFIAIGMFPHHAKLFASSPLLHSAALEALNYLCDENPRADRRHEVIQILQQSIDKAGLL